MKAFIEILREKYGLAQPEAEKLLEQMELLTYRKETYRTGRGVTLPSSGSRRYLEGTLPARQVDVSLWFASFKVTVSFPPGDMWPDFLLWFPLKL